MAGFTKWVIIGLILAGLYLTGGLAMFENPTVMVFVGLFVAVIAFSK